MAQERRKITQEDVEWGDPGTTVVSPGSHVGHRIDAAYKFPAPYVDVRVYGADPFETAANNTGYFNAALAAAAGKAVLVPAGTYALNTITCSLDDVHLVLMPGAVLDFQTAAAKGIDASGKNFHLSGGKFQMPATFDGANVAPTYAVVWITGSGGFVRDVTFINVPKVGIAFVSAGDGIVEGCRINGNYPAGSWTGTETGHFGITVYPPPATGDEASYQFRGNRIKGCVQGIFMSGAGSDLSSLVVQGNVFQECHNHGVYVYGGQSCLVAGNTFNHCSDPVATSTLHVVVSNNTIVTKSTAGNLDESTIFVRDAITAIVEGNLIFGDVATGNPYIKVGETTPGSLPADMETVVIRGNTIRGTGTNTGNAIVVQTSGAPIAQNVRIEGNSISGITPIASRGIIEILGSATGYGRNNAVVNNTLCIDKGSGATYWGIYLTYQKEADVTGNKMRVCYNAASATAIYAIRVFETKASNILNNHIVNGTNVGTNITITGYSEATNSGANRFEGNTVHLDPTLLAGRTFWSVAATTTVWDNVIEMNVRAWGTISWATGDGATKTVTNANANGLKNISLFPTNDAAADLFRDKGVYISADTLATSFALTTGDGTAPAATATIQYRIH